MGTLYQRNGIYYVDFYDSNGKRHQKSTGTKNKKLAEKILKRIEGDIVLNRFEIPTNNLKETSLKEFIKQYLEFSKTNKAKGTYDIEKATLDLFLAFVGNKVLKDIKQLDCEKYKIERSRFIAKTTANIEIRTLKSIFQKSVKWGFIPENPFKDIEQFKIQDNNIPKYLTNTQVNKLLESIKDGKFKNLIIFYLQTGCRRNEALDLKWRDVDLKNRRVSFHITKSRKSRTIPISKKLYRILENIYENQLEDDNVFDFDKYYVTHKIKKYFRAIGIDVNKSTHVLRHTFASHLVMNGVDLYTVQKLLGHSDLRVTEIYSHLAPDYLKISMEKLPF